MSNLFDFLVPAFVLLIEACWMTLAAGTNLRFPKHNRDYVVSVLTMELIKERSALYTAFKHRQITSPAVHRWCFRLLLATEIVVSVLLWLSVVALIGAALGLVEDSVAFDLATLSAIGFAGLWAGFLIGGEWFVYWASEDSPQYTHFFMLLWGLLSLVLLRL